MKRNILDKTAKRKSQWVVVLVGCLLTLQSAANTSEQSHQSIIDAVTDFAVDTHANSEKIEVSVSSLDKRLKLSECDINLRLFWPPGAVKTGQSSIGVECQDSQPWKIYVRTSIKLFDYVAVLRSAVNAGDLVSRENVSIELVDLSGLRGDSIRDFTPLLDHRFKRRLSSGRPLTIGMLAPPRLVHKGDDVVIVMSTDQLNVRMKGVAMEDGGKGSTVQIRNLSSQRIIQGQVAEKGVVRVVP